jgi:fructose-bisphosphate aldolase class I
MMNELATVAQALVSGGRGILPIDAPPKTCNARFIGFAIAPTEENRRAYREFVVTAPGIERYVGGMTLDHEAMRQTDADGRRFVDILRGRGIVPGVTVEGGSAPLPFSPGESVVEGLDGLRGRLVEYAALGAGFAKRRATFGISEVGGETPSDRAIAANAHALARFAALAQECGIVPILEPEVLAEGDHDIARCAGATERVLRRLFAELAEAGVALEAMVLQPNMVAPGGASSQRVETADVVAATLRVLGTTVPVAVAGIAFIAGAEDDRVARERLCSLNKTMPRRRPWPLTFSYGGALQQSVLAAWGGRADRVLEAQRILVHHAYCSGLAACGAYTVKIEDLLETFAVPIAA